METINNSKPRLIILSDLWGLERSDWLIHYKSYLINNFIITVYDSRDLGELSKKLISKQDIHNYFLKSGIEKAAANLLNIEKGYCNILGFSVGGYIAWKAGLSGLKINYLFAVSSTRIRKEKDKPEGNIELYFGDKDEYKPDDTWFGKVKLEKHFFKNEKHELYMKKENTKIICDDLIGKIYSNQ